MYTKLLNDLRPSFDAQIAQYVDQKGIHPYGSGEMVIGICHNGLTYRSITTEGMTEYIDCIYFLTNLGLVDILENQAPANGYDSLFVLPENRNSSIIR